MPVPVVYAPDTMAYPPLAMNSLAGASILPSVDAPAHGYTRISLPAPLETGNTTSLAHILVLILCVIGTLTCVYLLAHAFSGNPYSISAF